MIESCLIDTNILVRHLMGDPADQAEQCTAFLYWAGTGGLTAIVPPTVILEIVFTLERQYGATRAQVGASLKELLAFQGIQIEHREEIHHAIALYLDHRSVSYADAYHCALSMEDHDGVIVSLDRALGRVPGVDRREPAHFAGREY